MRCFVVALTLTGLSAAASAAPFAFVLNTNTTIEAVNVATNNDAPFGNTPFISDSLAIDPTNKLYSADGAGSIWDVTAGPIPVGPTTRTQIADLDYDGGGLWGFSNTTKELFFFNLGSSTVTYSQVISNLPGTATITGVAFQPSSGDTYLCGNAGLNNDFLLRIASASSSATFVGSMANGDGASYFSDIDFDAAGNLYAMSWFHRYFYTVSTSTAATSFVSSGPHRDTTGLALNPVPEPATLASVIVGLTLLKQRRQRTVRQ